MPTPDRVDGMSEPRDTPGRDWIAVVRTSGTPAFATAFAPEATLEASVLSAPLRGAEAIGRFFTVTRGMYDSIAFTSEHGSSGHTYLEWSGTIFGGPVAGVTVLSRDTAGRITSVCLYHRPLGMVTRLAAELARRLSGQVDPSALGPARSASR
jgi:hypothetical protein